MAGQWPLVVWVNDDTPEMIEYEAAQHELDSEFSRSPRTRTRRRRPVATYACPTSAPSR